MEWNVVLGHELKVLDGCDVGAGEPPLTPLFGVVGRDGDVPNRGVEPYVKDL